MFSKTSSSSSSSSRSRGSVYCSSSASSSSSSPVTTDDLDKLKVPELRERLAVRNLKVSGKKQELIARLRGGGEGGGEERETRSSGSISNEEEEEENNNNNNNINNGESTSDSSDSNSSSSSSGSKQLQQQQEQQQQPAVAFKRNVMNGKASPASFATEDLRLELDIAKDREDGKGFTGLEITWLGTSSGAPTFSSCLLYTSPSPRDLSTSRMPSSA